MYATGEQMKDIIEKYHIRDEMPEALKALIRKWCLELWHYEGAGPDEIAKAIEDAFNAGITHRLVCGE